MSAGDLAATLEVSRRTIYRDVDALGAAGVPVLSDRGSKGGIYLVGGYRTDLTGLTEAELEALLAFSGQGPAADLGLGDQLEQASRKLAVAASPRAGSSRLQERVLIDGERWFRAIPAPPHLARVQDAVWSDRRLRLRYRRTLDRIIERTVEPYGLVCKAGIWYLLARIGAQPRVYRVSRIEAAELTDETFERSVGFDLRSAWASQVGRFNETASERIFVKVRVDEAVSGEFARVVGEQIVDRLGNGVAIFNSPASDAAVSLLAAFGERVEVLEPKALRQRLAQLGHQLTTLYDS